MKNYQISDQQLIKNYRNGNEACFEMLLNRYKTKVFTSIYLIVNDKYIAEDIFQETFIKVVKTLKSESYNEEGRYVSWVMTIARNLAIDYYRKMARLPKIITEGGTDIFNELPIFDESREDKLMQTQNEVKVRDLIKLLPPAQLEVLVLRHYGELSFNEIAKVTQSSVNTCLGRMRYAIINLRKLIEEKSLTFH
jgi:RNA polymerase sigma factor (sigma-70 family)